MMVFYSHHKGLVHPIKAEGNIAWAVYTLFAYILSKNLSFMSLRVLLGFLTQSLSHVQVWYKTFSPLHFLFRLDSAVI